MQLTCKQCGTTITPPNINQAWARCPNCQAVFNLRGVETSTNLAQAGTFLAKGMSLELLPDGLKIVYNWFNPAYIAMLVFALIWSFGLTAIVAGWWLMIVPHFWIGLGLVVFALVNLVNKTVITVTPDELKIVHTPIPYPGNYQFDPITLKQLYVKEVKRQNKGSVYYTYDLYMTTWSRRDQKLLGGIEEARIALALEAEIEGFLQVKDRAIPGEFRWLSEHERNRLRQAWEALAASTSLTFNSGTASEKATVSGVYRDYYAHLDVFYTGPNQPKYTRLLLTPLAPTVDHEPLPTAEAPSGQPLTVEALLALLAPGGLPRKEGEQVKVSVGAKKIYYEQAWLETDTDYLRRVYDMMVNLAEGYTKLQAIGAEAIPALEILAAERGHILNSVARQLIRDIAAETITRLGSRPANFYCLHCFTRCVNHAVQPQPGQTIDCYGCRTCRQSQALFEHSGQIIAVLDSRMTAKRLEHAGSLYINWLLHRALFDFEAVEIIRASDEDIERFAVQVGNDTDPLRQPAYKQMRCRIALTCHLSENSLRVLRSVFGEVERGPLPGDVAETAVNDQKRELDDPGSQSVGKTTPD